MHSPAPLLLIVGPSGAGKDTLLDLAREALAGDSNFLFTRRFITRPANAGGEAHHAVSESQFEDLLQGGFFGLNWQAHGLSYGISQDDLDQRRAGRRVIASVSRTVITMAAREMTPVRVIHVTAAPEILADRLATRGRETRPQVLARLKRNVPLPPTSADVITVNNDGSSAQGLAFFLDAIRG